MIVEKISKNKVEQDYFFIKGKIDIDNKYFIDKIKNCWGTENQKKEETNIKGFMTNPNFFNYDENFIKIVKKFIECVDSTIKLRPYTLVNSWGFELKKNEFTILHNHFESPWSGVMYLNSSLQNLIFPDIKEEVKPEPGVFALFSGFLNHECNKNKEEHSKFGISFNMLEMKPF